MILLYLVSMGLLVKPSLYLSDFFERNRSSYYDALTQERVSNDLIHWVRFFLNGVAQTATKGREVFEQILTPPYRSRAICADNGQARTLRTPRPEPVVS